MKFLFLMTMLLSFVAQAITTRTQERTNLIRNIIEKNIRDTGTDLEKIHQEVSKYMPLDPIHTPEYTEWLNKKEAAVKQKFPMTDQQLRLIFSDRVKSIYPLYNIGDIVSVTYLLHGKPFKVTGKYYRNTVNLLYVGSAKIAKRNIPDEIASQFDAVKNTELRKKYIAEHIQSYHKNRNKYADRIFEDEIMQSQGYLKIAQEWISVRDYIQMELNRAAVKKGISLEQLIKGMLPNMKNESSPDGVEFDKTGTILRCYPKNAPNKLYKVPDSVKIIGTKAFEGCKNIERILLSPNVIQISDHAFENCTSLTMINLPETIERIGEYAFSNCKNLKSIIIPKAVTIIPKGCFNASGLENISIHDNILKIGKWALAKTKIKYIKIPPNVKIIEKSAFLGSNIKIESDNLFFKADKYGALFNQSEKELLYVPADIEKYEIPHGVSEIGPSAFAGSNIKEIHIPDSVKIIKEDAFSSCESLQSVIFSNNIISIGTGAFSLTGLRKVKLPNSIIVVAGGAFSYCKKLEEISFPEKVTTLEWAVCANCDNLRKVSVSPHLRQIKGRAFWDCKKLTEINIPRTVLSIEKGAFNGTPIAKEIEKNVKDTFKIPGVYFISFNWKFTLEDYRAQGYNIRYLGTIENVEEYDISNGYELFKCLKFSNKETPFCFIFSGKLARTATIDIAKDLEDPVKKINYVRLKSFDADKFDRGHSAQMAVVFSCHLFKILLQFDRKDNPQMAVYHVNDTKDEIYYRMLHFENSR